MGYFNHACTPRIPGRDFSGMVVEGPKEHIGKRVWGTGGAAGIDFDGTHAEYLALSINAISQIPESLTYEQAGSVTLPYVTAHYALTKRSLLSDKDSCLISGALGQVGRAAMSIAAWLGANPVGIVRGQQDLEKAQALGMKVVDSNQSDFSHSAACLNNNKPFDVILNTLGSIYWNEMLGVLSEGGRLATIGAPPKHRSVDVNLFELYRANQSLVGVNTVPLDYIYNAGLLNELSPGFDNGHFTAPPKEEMITFPMEEATQAYKAVLNPSIKQRVVLAF